MKTAKEYWISKFPNAEKDWQKTGHDDNFQVRMMEEYAKYYHEQQVKSVDLAEVVGRSEHLFDFLNYWKKKMGGSFTTYILETAMKQYLEDK